MTRFFGYKTPSGMSEERIIVAADVTSGEADDGKMLERLVEKTEENGVEIDTIIGDTAYSSKANLDMINDKNENENKDIKLCSPLNPVISNGTRKGATFDYNKDAGMFSSVGRTHGRFQVKTAAEDQCPRKIP